MEHKEQTASNPLATIATTNSGPRMSACIMFLVAQAGKTRSMVVATALGDARPEARFAKGTRTGILRNRGNAKLATEHLSQYAGDFTHACSAPPRTLYGAKLRLLPDTRRWVQLE